MRKAQQYVRDTGRFVRDYADGLNVRDLKRLFDRDAVEAYKVLARDQEAMEPGATGPKRFFHRVKVVFLGVSAKLAPARRMVFVAALAFVLLGLVKPYLMSTRVLVFPVGTGSLWFLLAVACLVYLLVVELVDRVRVRDELEVARQLQADLLPRGAPSLDGWSFAHSYRTANEVGGDYYDFLVQPDGRVALIVGDASGHGIAAGLLMAIANATLKTALDVDPQPRRVAALLNRTLYRTGNRRAFMTLFYGLLDPASGRLDWVCAGHPFPLVRRAGGGVEELGEGTLPLGMRPEVEPATGTTELDRGDLLLLYSDGLPEAVNRDKEAFGFSRLKSLLEAAAAPATIHDRTLVAFDRHVAGEPLTDDLTLVVVGRDP